MNPTYAAAGYTFRVETPRGDIGALLEHYLSPFVIRGEGDPVTYSVGTTNGDGPFTISLEGDVISEAWTVAWAVESVLQHVYQEAIEKTTEYLVVHAAAASWQGQGLVLSAPMDSGKTTLVTGLMRAGFDYLTDEAALLELETGQLHPFPKALTLEPPSIALMPDLREKIPSEFTGPGRLRYFFHPEDIRPGSIGTPSPVRHVIIPKYEPGAVTELRPMSRGEAVVVLAENSMNLPSVAGRGFRTVAAVAGGAQCYRLTMGDLDRAVAAVLSLVQPLTSAEEAALDSRPGVGAAR